MLILLNIVAKIFGMLNRRPSEPKFTTGYGYNIPSTLD